MEDQTTFENSVLLNFELLFSSRVETGPVQIILNIHPQSSVIYNLDALDFQREIDLETLGWRTRLLSPDYCLFCLPVRRQKLQQTAFFFACLYQQEAKDSPNQWMQIIMRKKGKIEIQLMNIRIYKYLIKTYKQNYLRTSRTHIYGPTVVFLVSGTYCVVCYLRGRICMNKCICVRVPVNSHILACNKYNNIPTILSM